MKQWQDIIREVMTYGVDTDDRTGVGTRSVFGTMARWNLQEGFPAVTTKTLAEDPCFGEAIWFILGLTNLEELREITWGKGSTRKTVWDDNYNNQGKALGYTDGYMGPIYGHQWRHFGGYPGVDQLQAVIDAIKSGDKSAGRRLIVSAWNPEDLPKMTLPPCHLLYQFEVMNGKLSCRWDQRSVDVFLGLPFNIASYALITHIIASICDLEVGDLILQGGNTHIYMNHFDQCKEVLKRHPLPLPKLIMPKINSLNDLENLTPKDFVLKDYKSWGPIKAQMAV